jgi:hypothetical protein
MGVTGKFKIYVEIGIPVELDHPRTLEARKRWTKRNSNLLSE